MRFKVTLRRRRIFGLTLAACSLALVASAPGAASDTDLRSPDAREAALAAQQPPASIDLRSPDSRELAIVVQQPPASVDLRSPDARDATSQVASGSASTPTSVAPQPTVIPVVDHGSQTLAIVFSSTALVIALVAIAFALLYRRPRPRWSAS
jgi:hypothetical protein